MERGISSGKPQSANVNLRSLGPARTLVLLNGRRQTYVPARLAGGRLVDVNAFPSIAIKRIDVLKEGAGAVYGSDAIAGVVNFITRSQFEGFEVSGSYDHFSGANDGMMGGIWGKKIGSSTHAVVAVEHKRSGRLEPDERDWTLRPYPGWGWGWSGTGNPGSFTFTSGSHPYADQQTTHATFVELALKLGRRVDTQLAAHFERYEFENSFDPKASIRVQLNDLMALRGTVQTSFRTPSVDDLNENLVTATDFVAATGTWKAITNSGSTDLLPEEALTYNLGIILQREPDFNFTLDYWGFDFNNPIGVLPHAALASAYANLATRSAVQERIFCPGNRNDGSCDPVDIERLRVHHINWPGIKTSGGDWHLGGRRLMGQGVLIGSLDGNHTWDF